MSFDQRKGYDPVTIVIHDRKRGMAFEDISLIAFRRSSGKVLAAGREAAGLAGEENGDVVALCPLKNGAVADFLEFLAMLRLLLQKAGYRKGVLKPVFALCLHPGLTGVERRAYEDALAQIGAKKVLLTEDPPEWVERELPRSCRYVIGVRREETRPRRGESWREACEGRITPGDYRLLLIEQQEDGLAVVLGSETGRIALRFNFSGSCGKTGAGSPRFSVTGIISSPGPILSSRWPRRGNRSWKHWSRMRGRKPAARWEETGRGRAGPRQQRQRQEAEL